MGFPGEKDEDFQELIEFAKIIRFDNLGVFKYPKEEGSAAALMKDQIPEEVKAIREKELMKLQKEISADINSEKVNKIYDVLIEYENEDFYIGRTQGMTPDIDGVVLIDKDKTLSIGEIVKIKTIEALEYDLIGVVCDESSK